MRTRRIRIGPQGRSAPPRIALARRRYAVGEGAAALSRLCAGLCVVIGIAAAIGAAWLIWQAPHCRPVPAHAYFPPLAAAQCGRDARERERAAKPRAAAAP
jgi:hypothetical protein